MGAKVKEYFRSLAYAFHIMLHPFDGFWDMKHEKRGSLAAAWTIIILTIITMIVNRQMTGFIFNTNDPNTLNIITEILAILGPLLMWCISNWCLTTLFDGEGSFKDIIMASGYALAPLVVLILPAVLLSNFLVEEEAAFYTIFMTIAVVWMLFLMFSGTMTVHQYTPGKTVLIIIAIVLGMCIILFLGVLFFTLLQRVVGFITELAEELLERL